MNKVLLSFLLLYGITVNAQEKAVEPLAYYTQKEIYTNLMGFEIDTIQNLELYKQVADWLYTDYHYGGKTQDGVDCSDFCHAIFQKAYQCILSGSSADLCKETNAILKSELREGDLVFFRIKKNRVSHVGIYLTKNKFAHATTKSGVIISDLNEDYYKKYFYRAGRIF